MTFEYTRCMIF